MSERGKQCHFLPLFEQLCRCHGGHGRHGHGGHRDVFEDGLCETGVGHFVLAEGPDDHLTHLPAGVTSHCQQRLDVFLPVEQLAVSMLASTCCVSTTSWPRHNIYAHARTHAHAHNAGLQPWFTAVVPKPFLSGLL